MHKNANWPTSFALQEGVDHAPLACVGRVPLGNQIHDVKKTYKIIALGLAKGMLQTFDHNDFLLSERACTEDIKRATIRQNMLKHYFMSFVFLLKGEGEGHMVVGSEYMMWHCMGIYFG